VKEKLDVLEARALQAERTGDYEKAADLKYGAIPDLKAHLAKMENEEAERRVNRNIDEGDESIMDEVVTPEDIAGVISRWTGIPVSKLSQTERERLLQLDQRLQQRVIGQNPAIREVTDAILRSKAGLSRENQPTGSFLFLGPTGVGKTELSKALFSELYDGDERHLVRIDMSEYQEQHSVARLIGAPPGYVGHDEGGQLTEAVRKKPYTVVLLDEVEKAHPKVLTILLQVLDEGRLTDSKGRTVDFTNTVIILTSNVGAEFLLGLTESSTEEQTETAHSRVMEIVRNSFAPEFLNRLSAIVMFNSLGTKELEKVVHKTMQGVKRRLASRGVKIELEHSGVKAILDASYDPSFGARPVERYLESTVVTTLSRMLISGELSSGTIVHIEGACVEGDGSPVAKKPRNSHLRYRVERDPISETESGGDHDMKDFSDVDGEMEAMPTQ